MSQKRGFYKAFLNPENEGALSRTTQWRHQGDISRISSENDVNSGGPSSHVEVETQSHVILTEADTTDLFTTESSDSSGESEGGDESEGDEESLEDEIDNVRTETSEHNQENNCNFEKFPDFKFPEADDHPLNEMFKKYLKPLKAQPSTTQALAIIIILEFCLSNGLNWSTTAKLFSLINELLGAGKQLPESRFKIKNMWKKLNSFSLVYHFICNFCTSLVYSSNTLPGKGTEMTCKKCNEKTIFRNLVEAPFFLSTDLKSQIERILKRFGNMVKANLDKIFCDHDDDILTDITGGSLYKQIRKRVDKYDLTLTFGTDGAPVFKSSNFSIWGVQVMLNELPPSLRFVNIVLCGLWFGSNHPDMSVYITECLVNNIKNSQPLRWSVNEENLESSLYCICGVLDAPARADVLNMISHNGYNACSWCTQKGIPIETIDGRLGHIRFPFSELDIERRSHDIFLEDARCASAQNFERNVRGIKGPTPLFLLPEFDVVQGIVPDHMHSLFLGVMRSLLEMYFSNASTDFYIGSPTQIKMMNERILTMKVPSFFSRLPRKLKDRKFLKAHELKVWLLFLGPVVFNGILPLKFFKNFMALSSAAYLLLQETVSKQNIRLAHEFLCKFCEDAEKLYGMQHMSYNMHLMTHLSQSAYDLGPLWAHSAFPFENYNGTLLKLVSAARGVPQQISDRYLMLQGLQEILGKKSPELTQSFKKVSNALHGYLCGEPKPLLTDDQDLLSLVMSKNDEDSLFVVYDRAVIRSTSVTSIHYTRSSRTANYFIELKDGKVGVIQYILGFNTENGLLAYLLVEVYQKKRTFPSVPHIFSTSNGRLIMAEFDDFNDLLVGTSIEDESFTAIKIPNRYEL